MIYCTEGKHANHYTNNVIHTILKNMQLLTSNFFLIHTITNNSFCHNFFHLLAQKPNLEKISIYSNKFFHNFHLSESSFTSPELQASGLAQRLKISGKDSMYLYYWYLHIQLDHDLSYSKGLTI